MSYTQEQVDVMNAEQDAQDQLKAHIDKLLQRIDVANLQSVEPVKLTVNELWELMKMCNGVCYLMLGGAPAMEALGNDDELIKCVSGQTADNSRLGYIGDVFGAPLYVPTENHPYPNIDPRCLYIVSFSTLIARRIAG